MINAFFPRLQRQFNIQPEEGRQVLLMGALALLPSVGGAIGTPGIEALFFARFGVEFLPHMYISLGLLTIVSTLTLTAALNRIPKSRLYRILPLTLGLLLLAARVVVSLDLVGFYPILWLGMYLFWTLQALFIWGIAGMLFDTRQAKRLFPLFAASGIFGNALGGLVTGQLVAWLGAENLLLIWALMLGLAFSLAWRLTRAYDPPDIHFHRPKPTLRETIVGGGVTVLKSPLLRWLSLATGLSAILLFALAFPFSKVVAAQFPDENALAGFLGVFQGVTTAVALLMSLAFANRLFARVGLMGALLVFALIYSIGFTGLVFIASFTTLVVFRFAQQAWMMGIADTAHQATFNTVPPEKREPARMFVDGIPRQIGVLLSGILLLSVQPVLSAQNRFAVSAVIGAVAVFAFWRARAEFTNSLAAALADGQIQIFQNEETALTELTHDRHTFEVLTGGLESADVVVRRTTLEILAHLKTKPAKEALWRSFKDPEPLIRITSLHALVELSAGRPEKGLLLEALSDASTEVRCEGIKALTTNLVKDRAVRERLEELLGEPYVELRALAAAQLLQSSEHVRAERLLSDMAQSGDRNTRRIAMGGYKAWGKSRAYDAAARGLGDADATVRSAALEAITIIDPEQCINPIKNALGDSDRRVRSAAADAMAAIGLSALPAALEALHKPELESGALLALERLSFETSEPAVNEFIRTKVARALEFDAMRRDLIYSQDGYHRFQLLSISLRDHARALLLRALRAFQLSDDRKKVALALAGLYSQDPDQRANALELLEALDDEDLITPALKIWEPVTITGAHPESTNGVSRRTQIILQLLESEDSWLRACAAFAAHSAGNGAITTRLQTLSKSDPDPLVRETAAHQSPLEESVNSINTLPIMERILFLQKVPLFAKLSAEELKQVASIAGEHIFEDKEIFVQEGELGDEMYIIVSGHVRVVTGKDRELELVRRGPGEYVGEMSILTHEPRMASLVADGDVFALCIEQNKFEHMLLEKPEIGLSVMRSIIHRLKDARENPGEVKG